MSPPDIARGNAAGLMAFMDFMIDKGYATAGAINPLKTAAKQVLSTVEGDSFEELDIRTLDTDEYMSRFANRSMGKYSSDSLRAYQQRFRRAVELYRSYLADPNWRPTNNRTRRPQKGTEEPQKKNQAENQSGIHRTPEVAAGPSPPSNLIAYPFPLRNGHMAQLHLPSHGLDRNDAERLTHFIQALVFDEPSDLTNSGESETS